MSSRGSLKDVIVKAEINGDYYMVSELIKSGFNMYMKNGTVSGYNYDNFVGYINDAYNTYLKYAKNKDKH